LDPIRHSRAARSRAAFVALLALGALFGGVVAARGSSTGSGSAPGGGTMAPASGTSTTPATSTSTTPTTGTSTTPAPTDPLCRAGDQWLHFSADGETHSALLHVPRGARGPLPLVLAFHGARYGAQFVSIYYNLSRLSDQGRNFAVLYPQASHNTFWQLPDNQTEDVEAVRALLDRVEGVSCIDSSRIYATGASNGGGFVARLGCEMADRLAAIAPVAGGYAALGPCHPARPLPVLEIHGTRDQVVPYWGKGPDADGSVAHFLGEWTELDGCKTPAKRTSPSHGVVFVQWEQCAAGSVVEHLRLAGTEHGWPGGKGSTVANPSGLDAAHAVWRFLSRFRLAAAS
jgi:polyhydroxybutyrate depolymerase